MFGSELQVGMFKEALQRLSALLSVRGMITLNFNLSLLCFHSLKVSSRLFAAELPYQKHDQISRCRSSNNHKGMSKLMTRNRESLMSRSYKAVLKSFELRGFLFS